MNVERKGSYERGGARDCADCWKTTDETKESTNGSIDTR